MNVFIKYVVYNKGQTIVEYSLLFSVVIAVFLALTPMIRRGTQGMVKIVSDEIGVQQNSEQTVDDGGLLSTTVSADINRKNRRQEEYSGSTLHKYRVAYNETLATNTLTLQDMGVSKP